MRRKKVDEWLERHDAPLLASGTTRMGSELSVYQCREGRTIAFLVDPKTNGFDVFVQASRANGIHSALTAADRLLGGWRRWRRASRRSLGRNTGCHRSCRGGGVSQGSD